MYTQTKIALLRGKYWEIACFYLEICTLAQLKDTHKNLALSQTLMILAAFMAQIIRKHTIAT